jgi:hypothetical protein
MRAIEWRIVIVVRPLSAANLRQGVGEEQGKRLTGKRNGAARRHHGTDPRSRVAGVAPAPATPWGPPWAQRVFRSRSVQHHGFVRGLLVGTATQPAE